MFNFLKKRGDSAISTIDDRISLTFDKANEDIGLLKQWVSHLHVRNKNLEDSHKQQIDVRKDEIHNVQKWVDYLQRHNENMKDEMKSLTSNIIELHKNNKELIERIVKIEQKNTQISPVRTESEPENESVSEPITRTKFETSMINQIRSNRKNYVIEKILNIVNEENLSTKQIERIVVHEKGLCGRTTFYSYLKELKDKKEVKQSKKGSKKVLVRHK